MIETMTVPKPSIGLLAAYGQYNELYKNVMVGIIVLTQENMIFYSNRYVEDLFGYSKEEITGKSVELLIHPRNRAQFEAYQEHYYHPRQAPDMGKVMNLLALRNDGTQFPSVFRLNHYELEVKDLLVEFLPEITIRRKEKPLLL